jgi:endonuclease/exonuclease/phosphatase family metal-dependent hydrolase
MTFNIQHGVDGSSQYNLQRAIDVIARIEPDLAALQEVTRNHPSYRCDDQPAQMSEGLRRATGQPWTPAYVQEWFTADRSCLSRGMGDGPETEGLAFLAPQALAGVTHTRLFNSRIGLSVRARSGREIPVIVTHLAASASGAEDRVKQLAQLLPWAEGHGVPRILLGDLNARPEAAELAPVMRTYRDAWAEARAAGTATGVPNGGTRVASGTRIDYIFYVPDASMTLESVETVDTAALIGLNASDHRPVVATFRVR